MKLVVLINPVLDAEAISLHPVRKKLTVSSAEKYIGADDRAAVETALQLKEAFDCEVTIISYGDDSSDLILREAIAMGADKGVLVRIGGRADAAAAASALSEYISGLDPDIVLTGSRCSNRAKEAVGSLTARYLGIRKINGIVSATKDGDKILARRRTAENICQIIALPDKCMLGISAGIKTRYMHAVNVFNAYSNNNVECVSNEALGAVIQPAGYEPVTGQRMHRMAEGNEDAQIVEIMNFLIDIGVLAKEGGGSK